MYKKDLLLTITAKIITLNVFLIHAFRIAFRDKCESLNVNSLYA